MDIASILARVARACVGEPICFAYVFGSVARNGTGRDLDVAVMPVNELSSADAFDLQLRLGAHISKQIPELDADVHCITRQMPLRLRNAIAREGKIAYSTDEPARVACEVDTMIEYDDYRPYNAELRRALIDQILEPGVG